MNDIPTKTYPPQFLRLLIADSEAERQMFQEQHRGDNLLQVEAMPEEFSAVAAPPRSTKSADTRAVEAYLQQSQRRDRYLGAVKALRNTLTDLQGGQTVSTKQMRDSVVELLDALLDMERKGGRDE